ncbi:hypothetical protein PVA45_03325 [Entomospira entomophila]|uniref:Uncharacterized protein n=1 Tax=Entomospira entomophila TaxID=2719988 RepID=A0A968KR91_9SPIO|nr:hypothetical protein [Entomospira entomophilus]NIZ40544.1 hypothetical protein [Entomospira entomophilus]WDI36102.1 hypothetical protein PVA45_03325 [Entomospira entomophilus]
MKRVLQSLLVMSIHLSMVVTLWAQMPESSPHREDEYRVEEQTHSDSVAKKLTLTNLRANIYPGFHDEFNPIDINYEVLDGLSNNILLSPQALALGDTLKQYAAYYQAPWYFLDFSTHKNNFNDVLRVRAFSDITAFRSALAEITHDADFSNNRHDFITVEEEDGAVVLYVYWIEDSMRMDQLLARLGFIQFATIYLPSLPQILRSGFSLYFEDIDLNLQPKELIRNRTFLKNIKEVETLYVPVINSDILDGDEEFLLTDSMLFAWLLVNYMYEAYDHQAVFFSTRAQAFQHMLESFTYQQDEIMDPAVIRENNRLLVLLLEEHLGANIQKTLEEHLNLTLNHYQAYMAGLYAFENRELERAKGYFIESAFSLREYYQPRYAIARIALYQADMLMDTLVELEQRLERATELERKGYEMEIQVVQRDIDSLMKQAREYFHQAKLLIEHHLTYRELSPAMRRELEEFHERILEFYRTYHELGELDTGIVAFQEMPTADATSYRY